MRGPERWALDEQKANANLRVDNRDALALSGFSFGSAIHPSSGTSRILASCGGGIGVVRCICHGIVVFGILRTSVRV